MDLEHEQLLIRLYYPSRSEESECCRFQSTHEKWLPPVKFHPDFYFQGIWGSIPANQSNAIIKPLMKSYLSSIKIPVSKERSLLSQSTAFPVAIFSHGLTGMRTFYSQHCGDLASNGVIVAAIEHKDGSAIRTGDYPEFNEPIEFEQPSTTDINQLLIMRQRQLSIRVQEVFKTLSFLRQLNQGSELHVQFKSRLDFDNLFISGHSFGSATALTVLQQSKEFKFGIIADPWLFPIDKSIQITTPILVISSETFTWDEQFEDLKGLKRNSKEAIFTAIKGSYHQSFSDSYIGLFWGFKFVIGFLEKKIINHIDPKKAHDIYMEATYKFMTKNDCQVSGREGDTIDDFFNEFNSLDRNENFLVGEKAFSLHARQLEQFRQV